MNDYFGKEVNVGDTILMSSLSLFEEHVVISIPSENTITVSTSRYRRTRTWSKDPDYKSWRNDRYQPLDQHNAKITKWVRPERIIRVGKFNGDIRTTFKTINQLENEFQTKNTKNQII